MKKVISLLMVLLLTLSAGIPAYALGNQSRAVIAADLTDEQIEQVYNAFGLRRGSVVELRVTNQEERQYLDGYVDSALIDAKVERTDVEVFYIPATQMAKDNGIATVANMIIVGHLLENHPELSFEGTDDVVTKLVPAKKAALVELNQKALALGKNYK